MKLFKRIYYPILALLLTLSLAFGFADTAYGGGGSKTFDYESVKKHVDNIAAASHNSHNPVEMEEVRDYITEQLRTQGFSLRDGDSDDDGNYSVSFATKSGKKQPTFTVQESVLTPETVASIESFDGGTYVISKTVRNVVAVIPGTDTVAGNAGDAVMFMAHYDSRPEGSGASDNAVAAAAMLGVMNDVMKSIGTGESPYESPYKNDLVFVFTDAEEEHMYGAYAFKYQFKGFDGVYDRVKLGANFDNLGNKGTLVMFQTSDKNSALVESYSKVNGGAFTSSIADFVYGAMTNFTDFEIFGEKTSLDFANVGGTDVYHTVLDNKDNVNRSSLEQEYSMMERLVAEFGGADLKKLSADGDSVYFSYFDMGVAHYSKIVAYVLGVIVLLLAIAGVVLNIIMRRKNPEYGFSPLKMAFGAAVQLLTMLATMAVGFVAYIFIVLLLAGFGVVPIHSMFSLRYMSIPLMVSVMLLSLAISFGFYSLFKKIFSVKSADVARGNTYIWGVIAVALSFAMPTLSYFFVITAIGALTVALCSAVFKDGYRKLTGEGMDRLFLYAVPLIFTVPMIIPILMIAASVLPAVYLPALMILFTLTAGFIAPYFTQLVPVLDALFAKLPKRMIRFERTVTKDVEDKAKKGKFTRQTVKEITKEPVAWRYRNYVGVSFISVVAVVLVMIFSSFNVGFSSAVAGGVGYRKAIFNDSLVYVLEKNGTQNAVRTIEVHDTLAYKYLSVTLDGFEWNATKNAYVKEDTALSVVPNEPSLITKTEGGVYTVTPYNGTRSEITVKIKNAKSITSVTFDNGKDEYKITNDGKETLDIQFPYGYATSFTFTVVGAETIEFEYTEHCPGGDVVSNLKEWLAVKSYFGGEETDPVKAEIGKNVRAGLVIRYNASL